jgi:hypothetical protein
VSVEAMKLYNSFLNLYCFDRNCTDLIEFVSFWLNVYLNYLFFFESYSELESADNFQLEKG